MATRFQTLLASQRAAISSGGALGSFLNQPAVGYWRNNSKQFLPLRGRPAKRMGPGLGNRNVVSANPSAGIVVGGAAVSGEGMLGRGTRSTFATRSRFASGGGAPVNGGGCSLADHFLVSDLPCHARNGPTVWSAIGR